MLSYSAPAYPGSAGEGTLTMHERCFCSVNKVARLLWHLMLASTRLTNERFCYDPKILLPPPVRSSALPKGSCSWSPFSPTQLTAWP